MANTGNFFFNMANLKNGVEYGYKVEYGKFEKTMKKISNKSH